MQRREKLPELLAPAGDFDCLVAAVSAGADAIYVGGKRFGARAFAKNFDLEELSLAVNYCHLHGVKLYVTVNTLAEDRELPEIVEYAAELYRIGVDAVIVADVGVLSAIKRAVPDLPIHASTQMSVHNTCGADLASSLGAERVVVARELPLCEISKIVRNSKVEIEVFLHGALCVCHSGQCLFSSLVGGRSGNRGECAQPCRLPFNDKYPLSLKDLSLAEHIPALIESGVASLKIEGRMKAPSYVYTVTRIYRSLLDEGRAATVSELDELRRAFSRGGFTDGYFVGKHTECMTGIRSDDDKKDTRSISDITYEKKRRKVFARVEMRLGQPSVMTLSDGAREITVYGAVPSVAQNAPLTHEAVCERLSKMGNTGLSLSPSDVDLTLEEGINLPPSAINALRRLAAEEFESSKRSLDPVSYTRSGYIPAKKDIVSARFFSEELFRDALSEGFSTDDFDVIFIPLFSESFDGANGVILPPVVFDGEFSKVKQALERAKSLGVKYALVSNIGQIYLARSLRFTPVGDFRLNVTNSESYEVYSRLGFEHLILSPELTLPKARDIGGSVITYGRIPLMITERCFIRENFGCKSCGTTGFTDRRGEKFPVVREFEHRNVILNSVPTYVGDKADELRQYKIKSHHLIFTVESAKEVCDVVARHKAGLPLQNAKVRRVGRR